MTEVVGVRMLVEKRLQRVATEQVDPHARQRVAAQVRHLGRVVRLLEEAADEPFVVDLDAPEARAVAARHRHRTQRHVGVQRPQVGCEVAIVHLVDVVARQDEHELSVAWRASVARTASAVPR